MADEILKILIELAGNATGAKRELQEVRTELSQVKNVALEVQGALNAAFGLGLLGGGLTMGLGAIIGKTIEWDTSIYHLSHVMNDNAADASKWMAIAQYMGVPVDKLTMAMGFLSRSIDTNNKVFKEMGVETRNADGSLRSLDQVLTSSIGYFQAHAGSSDLAAKAKALFSRAGVALLPILQAEGSTLRDVTEQARKLGLIMSNETLAGHMQAVFAIKNLQQAFQGLMVTLGNGLLPILAVLANMIVKWVTDNIVGLQRALGSLVSFIVGFISGLTGAKIELSKVAMEAGNAANATSDFGDNADTAAGSANNLADAERQLREQTKQATDAINDQITAIQASDRQLDQQANDQIKALEDQGKDERTAKEKVKLEQKINDDKQKIDKLHSDYQAALQLGDLQLAQSINDQLTAAEQTLADDEQTLQTNADNAVRDTKIENIRSAMDARHRAHQDMLDGLREQLRVVQENAQKQLDAMTAAAKGMDLQFGRSFGNMNSTVSDAFAGMGRSAKTSLDKLMSDSKTTADTVGNFFGKSLDGKASTAGQQFGKDLHDMVTGKRSAWESIGEMIGHGITYGMTKAIVDVLWGNPTIHMPGWLDALIQGLKDKFKNSFPALAAFMGFAEGGIVPGPMGSPQMAVVHGGEVVLNPAQQRALLNGGGGGRGGHTFNITVYGATSSGANDTARAIKASMLDFFGQR